MTARVKLQGGPEKTATWIWLEAGKLKIEFYDFSETAQRMFGNDIAYILTIYEMSELYSRASQDEDSLVHWMTENFKSYFDVKKWLEENGIGFHKEVDPWA